MTHDPDATERGSALFLCMRSRCLVLAVALVGCSKGAAKSPAQRATEGAKLATVGSPPRADWPVRMIRFDKDSLRKTVYTFTYGELAACKLSALLALDGVIGCATSVTYTLADGEVLTKNYTYDGANLAGADSTDYHWEGDVVTGEGAFVYRSLAVGSANLAWTIDDQREDKKLRTPRVYRVENGVLVAQLAGGNDDAEAPVRVGAPTVELTWSGNRLTELDERSAHSYLEYADAPRTEPYPEQAERTATEARTRELAQQATFRAAPRADWPCARTLAFTDKTRYQDTFHYGAMETCTLPIDAVVTGVTGCPTGATHAETDAAGETTTSDAIFRYDDQGRLVFGGQTFHWRDDGLYAGVGGSYAKTDTGFSLVSKYATIDYAVKDGKPVLAGAGAVIGTNVLSVGDHASWNGHRIATFERVTGVGDDPLKGTGEFTYDCATK